MIKRLLLYEASSEIPMYSCGLLRSMVSRNNEMREVLQEARELGERVRTGMESYCRDHLSPMECHPVSDEFRGTARHREFQDLLYEYMKCDERVDEEDPEWMVKDECYEEVREAFDEGFWSISVEDSQCPICDSSEEEIVVNNPDALLPEKVLDGSVQSGTVGRDNYDEEARWQ